MNFVKHFEMVMESVFADRLKHKPKLQMSPPKAAAGGHHETSPPEGGESIADAARDLQNKLSQSNAVHAGLYSLFSLVNDSINSLLAEDRPISLFTTVDLGPLLLQIGQWALLTLFDVQQRE